MIWRRPHCGRSFLRPSRRVDKNRCRFPFLGILRRPSKSDQYLARTRYEQIAQRTCAVENNVELTRRAFAREQTSAKTAHFLSIVVISCEIGRTNLTIVPILQS